VPCACVDIGSNTTRLLLADYRDGTLRELMTQRVFTRIGRSIRRDGAIPADKVTETTDVVERQVRHARELGADRIAIVATAAVRDARNGADLMDAIKTATGLPAQVLSEADEARLAFLGASRTLGSFFKGNLCVVDVGGGSTEIAIGSLDEGVIWSRSFRVGSGFLADSYLLSDPPSSNELEAARAHTSGVFEGLQTPAVARAVASGGSATSLRRMAGAELTHDAHERAIRILASAPADEVAERFALDPERVRLLPAGVLILDAVGEAIGHSLKIGNGGIREGVVLELAAATA
jgi:exopolyphosphatase/guanosine-5'-triphosphate,3'-diphosphate pyrophosphatase